MRITRSRLYVLLAVLLLQAILGVYLSGLWRKQLPASTLSPPVPVPSRRTQTKQHSPPPPSPPKPIPMAFSDELELRSTFLHLVDELQNPPDCKKASLYVYVPTAYSSGIGSQVRMIANSMMQAITLGRTFVVDAATSPYVHPSRCPDRGYNCLFLPLSKCTLADAMAELPRNETAEKLAEEEANPRPELRLPPIDGDLKSTSKRPDPQLRVHRHRLGELRREPLPAGPDQPRVIAGRSSCFQMETHQLNALFRVVDRHIAKEAAHRELVELAKVNATAAREAARAAHARELAKMHNAVDDENDADRAETRPVPAAGWWLQQLVGYIARPTARVIKFADDLAFELRFVHDLGEQTPPKGRPIFHSIGYLGVHIRRGDKRSEAVLHDTSLYGQYVTEAHTSTGKTSVLLASDDSEPYEQLPEILKYPVNFRVKWLPFDRFYIKPTRMRLVAAKTIDQLHKDAQAKGPLLSDSMQRRAQLEGDEGELQLAQLVLLSRATALIGTLTSNYLLLAYEMAVHARALVDEYPPALLDLDGNDYYPCSIRDPPPWGPLRGKSVVPYSKLDRAAVGAKGGVAKRSS